MTKLPISALVASYNEEHLLEDCLKSLQFCDEIYFVNLGSADNSVEIARKYAHTVEIHPHVEIIEEIHPKYIPALKHDWFILIDPDERIRPELAEDIIRYVNNPQPYVSLVRVPILYLFKGKKLKGGPYKEVIHGRLLFYRPGLVISDEVHTGITAKAGYGKTNIPFTGANYDEHYWCNSWAQLRDKHNRYAQGEGKVLYLKEARFSYVKQIWSSLKRFFTAYFKERYYKDGLKGLGFAYHQARYTFLSWRSLKRYQRQLKEEGKLKTPQQVLSEQFLARVRDFEKVSNEIAREYSQASDELRQQILKQYRKSVHRIINDALVSGHFDEVVRIQRAASFSQSIKDYIAEEVFMERFKLIHNSGSYRLARNIRRLLNQ